MLIKSLEIRPLTIPFKVSFKHASAERKMTQSVLVIAKSSSGRVGLGEGCPREYVTQESIGSCLSFFKENKAQLLKLSSYLELKKWTDSNQRLIDKNPAAWCAMEMAILDLIAKQQKQSIESLLGLPELEGNFHYTAVLGDSPLKVFKTQVEHYAQFGFQDFKVKVSGDVEQDRQKLHLIQKIAGSSASIRLDANNLWQNSKEAIAFLDTIKVPINAIEEPLNHFDYKGMLELFQQKKMRIILDESFLNQDHFNEIKNNVDPFILNLRVSKMGGLIRSVQIAQNAQEIGLPIIVGAQVGETSLLTRAALSIANAFRTNLMAQEGAFGTLLLESDITSTPLQFGARGILEASTLTTKKIDGMGLDYKI